MCEIKNTIRFQFSHGQEKPDMGDICNFAKGLDADPGQMEAVYRIGEERSIFIKFRSEESMLHALNFNTEELIFHYANGKTAEVHMSDASEYIEYIRVYDLPPEVPDNELEKVLKKYGKVKRVIREKFPVELNLDACTGVRGIYMDVKKEIPTSLHFLNRKGNIFYDGNKGRCCLCKAEGHLVLSCPKRKARKQPEQQNQGKDEGRSDPSSYAGVVTGAAAAERIEVLDEEVMAIDEMTPQTEGNRKEEQASGSQVQQVDVNDPKYKGIKEIFDSLENVLKKKTEEMKKEERRKLQARSKANRKQSPPRSPHRKS